MTDVRFTRRAVLGALAVSAPAFAYAQPAARFGRVAVDVSPLRRFGDAMDAEYFAEALPGFLHHYFAPYLSGDGRGPLLVVRIDGVQYGATGVTLPDTDVTVDNVEATGIVGGSEYPLFAAVPTRVDLNDMTGQAARTRMRNMAQAVAQYLPGKMGLY